MPFPRPLSILFVLLVSYLFCGLGQEVGIPQGISRVHSLEALGDGGELVFRGSPLGRGESFVGGYLLGVDGTLTCLISSEPVPNPMNWSWQVVRMGGVPSEAIWGLRREPTDSTGANWRMRLLLQGDEKESLWGGISWKELWTRKGEGGSREFLVYRGRETGWQGRILLSTGEWEEGGETLLEADTGLRPVLDHSWSRVAYLSQEETDQLGLRLQGMSSGASSELVEFLGRRQELGVFNGEYLGNLSWLAATPSLEAIAYPAVDGARGVRLRLATRQPDGAWAGEWVSPGAALEPQFSQDGRFLLFRTTEQLLLLDRERQELRLLAEEVDFPAPEKQTGPACRLSSNGRHVAWMDQAGHLFRLDLGANVRAENALVHLSAAAEMPLGIQVSGAEESTTLQWVPEDSASPGPSVRVVSQDTGEEIPPGRQVSWKTLPWRVSSAEGKSGETVLRFCLDSGDFCRVTLCFTDFLCLTPDLVPASKVYSYPCLSFPQEGTIQVLTDAPLAGGAQVGQCLYRRETRRGESWRALGELEKVAWAQATPGEAVWLQQETGALFFGTQCVDASPHAVGEEALAVSRQGAVATLLPTGELRFSADAGENWESLSQEAASPFLSADGSTVIWREGKKVRGRLGREGSPMALTNRSVSALLGMTHDGARVLCQAETGEFLLLQAPFTASGKATVLPIPPQATMLRLSPNGRRVAFLYTPEGESLQRVGVVEPLDEGATLRCLTPEAVLPPRALAISPSGRQIAFTTCADMERGGGQVAENGHWNLYLWEDPLWENRGVPQFTVTALNPIPEDAPETNLRLVPQDSDGDAVALWVSRPPAHGALRLVPPDAKLPYPRVWYRPNPDFCGEETFSLTLFDGEKCEEIPWRLPVAGVNDPPTWPGEMPGTISVTPGGETTLELAALDPDLDNTPPDSLAYTLQENNLPGAQLTATSPGKALLTLRPPLSASPGDYSLVLQVTDEAGEHAEHILRVQVLPLPEVALSLALLREASLAPQDPSTPGERIQAALAGCWQEIPLGQAVALSLPGEVDVSALRALLETEELFVWQDGAFVPCGEGRLPAGRAFWATPGWASEPAGERSILLTPASQRQGECPFAGPLLEEAPPSGGILWNPQGGFWKRETQWQIGRGYFLGGDGNGQQRP